MKFNIEASQYVALRKGCVCFDYKACCRIVLSRRQFFNLHDIVHNAHYLRLESYPLSDNMWLCIDREGASLRSPDSFFQFHSEGWKKYIRSIHPAIHFIFAYGERDCDQHDVIHARRRQSQSRGYTSRSWRQTVSRPSRDVTSSNEQRSQRTALSSWNSSDSRETVSGRSRKHASRTSTTSSDQHDDSISDLELSDQCSIEDVSMSSKDCVE